MQEGTGTLKSRYPYLDKNGVIKLSANSAENVMQIIEPDVYLLMMDKDGNLPNELQDLRDWDIALQTRLREAIKIARRSNIEVHIIIEVRP